MTSERENGNDVQSLIDQLLQGVKSIDKEDLVRLAKLHGLCEALTTATGPEAEQPNPPVFESASSLVHDLEASFWAKQRIRMQPLLLSLRL